MRFRYTGQQLLAPLNLYYYKARIYSPTLGRFLQTDPIGQKDDMNLYAYVKNNAINSIDPTGLYEKKSYFESLLAGNGSVFSQAQKGIPNGLNNISNATGMDALFSNYKDMKQDNTVGNDKFFHCKAHCEASTQGSLGYISSQVIGMGREVSDFARPDKWNSEWQGSLSDTYNYKKDDSSKDLEANKTGRDGGANGKSCSSVCAPYIVPGINKRYLK